MLTLALVVLPVARAALGPGPQLQRLMGAIHARLRWVVCVSIVGLAVTGVMLSQRSDAFEGFFAWSDDCGIALPLKHVAVILMAALALTRSALLSRPAAAEPRPSPPSAERGPSSMLPSSPTGPAASSRPSRSPAARVGGALLGANVVLAIVVLVLSAYSAAVA